MKFIFEFILSQFGFHKILMSDRDAHFLNETIALMLQEFQVYHQKSTPYLPKVNGTVKSFNKILESALKKVYNAKWNDWDVHIPIVLWAYRTTYKKMTDQTPFPLVYGQEAVMAMEYIVPSLYIVTLTDMVDRDTMEERLTEQVELEEDVS